MAWQKPNSFDTDVGEETITTAPSATLEPLIGHGHPEATARNPQGGQSLPKRTRSPPGLERLVRLDKLIVDQQTESLEACLGCETQNKYMVKDVKGHLIYHALEVSDSCERSCCGSSRAFEMPIMDTNMREVIRLYRPMNAFTQEMEVFSNGRKLGSINQIWNPIVPSFSIRNATGKTVFSMQGPALFGVNYNIFTADDNRQIGKIKKNWGGLSRELFTDADSFGISFPVDLDVTMKAVLLGACFLIDFMYYENNN